MLTWPGLGATRIFHLQLRIGSCKGWEALGKDFEFQPPYFNQRYFLEQVEGVIVGRYRKVEVAQIFSVVFADYVWT